MNEQTVVHLWNRILFSHEKMDSYSSQHAPKTRAYYAKQRKQDSQNSQRQTHYILNHMQDIYIKLPLLTQQFFFKHKPPVY
jgi:hypothetical protein